MAVNTQALFVSYSAKDGRRASGLGSVRPSRTTTQLEPALRLPATNPAVTVQMRPVRSGEDAGERSSAASATSAS